jgi:L-aminopeptidase/D-esterase-like protein
MGGPERLVGSLPSSRSFYGAVVASVRSQHDDPFRAGSLVDVAGLRVGHHQRSGRGWQTGTTVVFAPAGAVAAVDVRGGGPGTRETDALDPRNLVDRIHAVCLTGGSAYGLAAADGVVAALEARRLGVPVGPDPAHVVPVVPAAVIFDLGRGGPFGNRPTPQFGARALAAATARRVQRGSVGAGTGARSAGLQGGVGMASVVIAVGERTLTVAALAVVNSSGSAIDSATGLPWSAPAALRRPTASERQVLNAIGMPATHTPPLNTTIGVVATDADLTRSETGRMAQSAHDGLARALRPAHGLTDGDTIFGLALGDVGVPTGAAGLLRTTTSRAVALNRLFAAAADAFAAACADAVVTAITLGAAPAYRDVCPSAFRRLPS